MRTSLSSILSGNGGDLTDHDVAVLSDWASGLQRSTPNPDWKRAYALIREGADLLLRRRARSTADLPHEQQPEGLNHQTYVKGTCTLTGPTVEVTHG